MKNSRKTFTFFLLLLSLGLIGCGNTTNTTVTNSDNSTKIDTSGSNNVGDNSTSVTGDNSGNSGDNSGNSGDNSGNSVNTSENETDTTLPYSPSISINSGATSSNTVSVTLALSASDNIGVSAYYVSENGATPSATSSGWTNIIPTQSYSANVSFSLSTGEGTKVLYVWYKDATENISASVTDSIIYDSTSPENPSILIESGATSTSSRNVTLTLSASDSIGVTGYYASEISTTPSATVSGWTNVPSSTSYFANKAFTLSNGDGSKTVYVWFKDAAHNISLASSNSISFLSPDTTAPTGTSVSINSGAQKTGLRTVTLTLLASDSTGIIGYYASENLFSSLGRVDVSTE